MTGTQRREGGEKDADSRMPSCGWVQKEEKKRRPQIAGLENGQGKKSAQGFVKNTERRETVFSRQKNQNKTKRRRDRRVCQRGRAEKKEINAT